jgi:hypothetical protein
MARLKISLGGFADPVRRPRWIIWTVVALMLLVGVMVPVLGITSTRWFCSEGCHKVQDDTITAYQHSTHAEISCMACHMPVNANAVVFLLHKMEALGELAMTVTNNYELPLNGEDEVALTMSQGQCTQCHDESKRKVTPDAGLRIDHAVHLENGVACTICHNRIAHNEDFKPVLKDPKTGKPNKKHVNFMEMTACFRCHSQEKSAETPPGDCSVCHTPEFQLLPKSHKDPKFFPKKHGKLALAQEKRAPWMNETDTKPAAEAETAAEGKSENAVRKETKGEDLKKVEEINECSTCHTRSFCTDCHGVPMPHPNKKVWDKTHGDFGRANPTVCAKCHGGQKIDFCNSCHHGTHIEFTLNKKLTWKQQHMQAVKDLGAAGCIRSGGCHSPTYCATCHANGGTQPSGAPPL